MSLVVDGVLTGQLAQSVEAAREVGMAAVVVAGTQPLYELGAADLVVRQLDELSLVNLKQLFRNEAHVEGGAVRPALHPLLVGAYMYFFCEMFHLLLTCGVSGCSLFRMEQDGVKASEELSLSRSNASRHMQCVAINVSCLCGVHSPLSMSASGTVAGLLRKAS